MWGYYFQSLNSSKSCTPPCWSIPCPGDDSVPLSDGLCWYRLHLCECKLTIKMAHRNTLNSEPKRNSPLEGLRWCSHTSCFSTIQIQFNSIYFIRHATHMKFDIPCTAVQKFKSFNNKLLIINYYYNIPSNIHNTEIPNNKNPRNQTEVGMENSRTPLVEWESALSNCYCVQGIGCPKNVRNVIKV